MPERPEPDLDHVRDALRQHDERQDEPPPAEPEDAPDDEEE